MLTDSSMMQADRVHSQAYVANPTTAHLDLQDVRTDMRQPCSINHVVDVLIASIALTWVYKRPRVRVDICAAFPLSLGGLCPLFLNLNHNYRYLGTPLRRRCLDGWLPTRMEAPP